MNNYSNNTQNYSTGQLVQFPSFLLKFFGWLRKHASGEETINIVKEYAKKHKGLDDAGNIDMAWAKKQYKKLAEGESLLPDPGANRTLRVKLEELITEKGAYPERLFE